jgi:hypothetical protein
MSLKLLLIFLGLCVPFFLLTVWAVVDVAQRDFGSPAKKALWWIVASIPFLGFLPYFIIGRRMGKKID